MNAFPYQQTNRTPAHFRRGARWRTIALAIGIGFSAGPRQTAAQVALREIRDAPGDSLHAILAVNLTQLSTEIRDKAPGALREAAPVAFGELDLGLLRYIHQRASVLDVGYTMAGAGQLGVAIKVALDADRERRTLVGWRVEWKQDGSARMATAVFSGRIVANAAGTELHLDALLDQVRVEPQLQALRDRTAPLVIPLGGRRIGRRTVSTANAGLTPGTTIQSVELISVSEREAVVDALVASP